MPTPFETAAASAVAAVHARMAKDWILSPYTPAADVNAPAVPDPSRSCVTVRGIYFDAQAAPLIPNGFDPRTSQRPGTMGGKPRIEFLPADVAAAGGLRASDQIEPAEGGQIWRIESVYTKPYGVVVATVNLL